MIPLNQQAKKHIIYVIAIIMFMELLDATVLNTSLPQIARSLHTNPIELKVAITTYLLTLGIFIPVSGWLVERIGEPMTLMLSITIFLLSSIGCAFSVNLIISKAMRKQVSQDDIIYFIVTDRFFGRNKRTADPSDNSIHGGTLDGIIDKLDYLLELGVTTVWVTPVYENIQHAGNSEPYHYYWPKSFEQIDSRLLEGTHLPASPAMSTFGKFVDICEKLIITVL